ncbi:MAG: hypothetical protein Q8Q36_01060 [bacterium]|nr:hypothetical protein [bacterium]
MARSIQDIVIHKKRKRPEPPAPREEARLPVSHGNSGSGKKPPKEPPKESRTPDAPPDQPRFKWRGAYGVALVSFVFLLFSLSLLFVGAEVTVYPKRATVTVSKSALASKDGATPLHFNTLELSRTESMEAQATGQKEVKRKASGTIIVYNAYGPSAQKLIKNTRFETADGKIYRIASAITVPGTKVDGDGKTVLGSVETVVYADEPGEEYNIGKTDFTLPGFKGTARYAKFYARSKTNMQGGMIGMAYAISPDDEADAKRVLESRLREILLAEAKKNVPEGYILYESGVFLDFSDLKVAGGEGTKNVTVEKEGKFYALLWNRGDLAKFIAQTSVDGFDGAPVESPTLDALSLAVKNKESIDYPRFGTITISLSGPATVVWALDKDALADELKGKPKKSFQSILSRYGAVDRAELSLSPFWAQSLPDDKDDIEVTTVLE